MNSFVARFGATALLGTALATVPMAAQGQEFINVLTGGTSGVYYPLGVALSEIYADGIYADGAWFMRRMVRSMGVLGKMRRVAAAAR